MTNDEYCVLHDDMGMVASWALHYTKPHVYTYNYTYVMLHEYEHEEDDW